MKKKVYSIIKAFLFGLLVLIILVHAVPIKSRTVVRAVLSHIEKTVHNMIEFDSAGIWIPGAISMKGVTVIDEVGRLYYCKSAELRYNLVNLVLKRGAITFDLEQVKFYRNIGLLDSLTDMLIISKMPDIEFAEIKGALQMYGDNIYIKNAYAYNDTLRIRCSGWVDRTGSLDCDVTFSFHKDITDKIPDVVKKTLLMPGKEEGWMYIAVNARGNYKKPSLRITGGKVKLNITEGSIRDD